MRLIRPQTVLLLLLLAAATSSVQAQSDPWDPATAATPLLRALSGSAPQFRLSGDVYFDVDDQPQHVTLVVVRYDDQSFDVALNHRDYAVEIRRRAHATAFALPRHNVVFIGSGPLSTSDHLSCNGLGQRLVSSDSSLTMVTFALSVLAAADVKTYADTVISQAGFTYDTESDVWRTEDTSIGSTGPGQLTITSNDITVRSTTVLTAESAPDVSIWPGFEVRDLPRDELETTLVRGVRRAGEILQPAPSLVQPEQLSREVPHGRLTWQEGQRIATLWGTPEQIGEAHGRLLQNEALRCIDSVLYTFGTANVIRTGRWFRHELDAAYARLEPHIPERHKRETRALARALRIPEHQAEILNVFPELFHCSGFAVFDSATKDGKLYHGRVLDYMTTIGLQDAATTFIVRPDGRIPFANVGYAAFTGSVSGMNAAGISLGEMGGRGEGLWDGVPMATLMRRGLEECDTLPEVIGLFRDSPRTCEYYYVFSDGKTNDAVGVAATPASIEFVGPGEAHELLGDGIPDAVVLSAGSRLEELRRRVRAKHGQIDADTGIWLMSRPVAMESNLHNVLFVPEDGIFFVANAGHGQPAAEMPYVRIDLHAMLESMAESVPADTAAECSP